MTTRLGIPSCYLPFLVLDGHGLDLRNVFIMTGYQHLCNDTLTGRRALQEQTPRTDSLRSDYLTSYRYLNAPYLTFSHRLEANPARKLTQLTSSINGDLKAMSVTV